LSCVESVNHPSGHMVGRRLLTAGVSPTRSEAADSACDLKALAAANGVPAPAPENAGAR
jgi:3-phenylpropionate/trans-cinnamate dioxygenase ferredoxin reductase component